MTQETASEIVAKNRQRERPLTALAGWMIAAALVYAPFAFGSVPPWAIEHLVIWLSTATGIWALDCVLARRLPKIPLLLLLSGVLALACGWFLTWNAHTDFQYMTLNLRNGVHLHAPVFVMLHPHFPKLPGAEEHLVAKLMMQRLDALFGMLLVVTDLARKPMWREQWLSILSWTGAGIALFGLVQQQNWVTFVAARMNQWEGTYFSTFNYHANAGAYLNLVLPVLLALTLARFLTPDRRTWRIGPLLLLIVVLTAVLANTSRGAQAISVLLVIGVGLWGLLRFVPRNALLFRYRHVVLPGLLILALLGAGVLVLHFSKDAAKWRELPGQFNTETSRWQVWRVTVPMAKTAGALGHGPGSFKMLLPQSPLLSSALYTRWIIQRHTPGEQISMWSMAHNDYLQTMVEFGWVGLILGGVTLFGGIFKGIRQLRRYRPASLESSSDPFLYVGVVAALIGVAIHSTFDFPLQIASIQVTVALLLGICWSASAAPPHKTRAQEAKTEANLEEEIGLSLENNR